MSSPRFSPERTLVIFIICFVIGALLFGEIITPFRRKVSDRYLQRGDTLLAAQDFSGAQHEYLLALNYNPQSTLAKSHQALAKVAVTDIAQARSFYEQQGINSVVVKLNRAQQHFTSAKEALKTGVDFYAAQDFSYAQYPLQQAVMLDAQYAEAWHYLGLTYQELAKADASYTSKAQDAFTKRNLLSPSYLFK